MREFIRGLVLASLFVCGGSVSAASALSDWAFNIDSTVTESWLGDGLPSGATLGSDGLGVVSLTVSGAGQHNVHAFFDFEFDESINGVWNEYGLAHGSAPAGLEWEIDEPGYVFGDIEDNLFLGALDNTNAIPSSSPDDVSFAVGWVFELQEDELAEISFNLSNSLPFAPFFLSHSDPETGPEFDQLETIYLSSALDIRPVTNVPVPPMFALFLMSIIGLFGTRKRRG